MKQWVALALIGLGLILLRLLWQFLTPLALALLLTYILNPIVNFVETRTRWPRIGAVLFVYLILILALLLAPLTVVPILIQQITGIALNIATVQQELIDWLIRLEPISVAGVVIEPTQWIDPIVEQAERNLVDLVPISVDLFFGVATTFVASILWLVFILVVSFYLVRDAEGIGRYLWQLVPPAYIDDASLLAHRINTIWNAFLRGQLLLSGIVGMAVTIALLILGVPNALLLGLLAGILEMLPNIGPVLSMIPAVLIALFSGSTNWEISNGLFAIIVVVTYFIIQQVENNYLVPRIIGGSVHLHPVVVLVGAIVGANLAGILGIFLAAPVLASIRVVAGYAYKKLLDDQLPTTPSHADDVESETIRQKVSAPPIPAGAETDPGGEVARPRRQEGPARRRRPPEA
jgi:predicted PurR-regulated permease PerM